MRVILKAVFYPYNKQVHFQKLEGTTFHIMLHTFVPYSYSLNSVYRCWWAKEATVLKKHASYQSLLLSLTLILDGSSIIYWMLRG